MYVWFTALVSAGLLNYDVVNLTTGLAQTSV